MNVLLLEPFFSGSHQQWAEGYQAHSRHNIRLLTLPGRHWKWRMAGGAVELAAQFANDEQAPDLILASDMLDLPSFLGLARRCLAHCPAALYFHENQLTYPWSPEDEDVSLNRDYHYAMFNYRSALAADGLFFNSHYHQRSFLGALPDFLRQFPSPKGLHRVEGIAAKSKVLHLGMDLSTLDVDDRPARTGPPVLLWNHRWEYDKAPGAFFQLLYRLQAEGLPFRLIVLGASFRHVPEVFEEARERLAAHLLHWGYAESREAYARLLWQADLLPVTSQQDFFGGSVVEGIYCNTYPLLPRRLAYPEHIPQGEQAQHLYDSEEELFQKTAWAIQHIEHIRQAEGCQHFVSRYDWRTLAPVYDEQLEQLRFAHTRNH